MEIKKIIFFFLAGILLTFGSFFADGVFFDFIDYIQNDVLTWFFYIVTNPGIVFIVVVLTFFGIKQKKYRHLVFMFICLLIAVETAYILKNIFQVPRPNMLRYEDPIFLASGFSFPSIHAAFAASLMPFQKYFFKGIKKWPMFLLLFLVIVSRVYLEVHTLSDVVAGAAIGFLISYSFIVFDRKYKLIEWFTSRVTDKFELRRQFAHFLIGVAIVFLLKFNLLNYQILFFITAVGGVLVLVARRVRVPLIHDILEYFERPRHIARFPGRGSFFLMLGAALSVFVFEKQTAMAAIMIMAVGDSVTNIVGRHFGVIKNPFNKKKNLEGTFFAIFLSTLAAFYFVPFLPAFLASVASMTIESIDLGWKRFEVEIDDNVIIPLIAGAVITMMI
jgi:membrane-associated phospholipid phosphatase